MEEKPNFRNISLRNSVVQQVEEFLEANADFVAQNPECKSVAGFVTKASLEYLKKLKNEKE